MKHLIRTGLILTGLSVAVFFATLVVMETESQTAATPAERIANFDSTLDWEKQPESDSNWRTAVIEAGPHVLCGSLMGFIAGVNLILLGVVLKVARWCIAPKPLTRNGA